MVDRNRGSLRAGLLFRFAAAAMLALLAARGAAALSVTSTVPFDGASNVALPTNISVTFNQTLDGMALSWQSTAGACTGTLQVSPTESNFSTCVGLSPVNLTGPTYTFAPTPALANGSLYRIRVKGTVTASGMPMGMDYTQLMGFFTHADLSCATGLTISQIYANGGQTGSTYAQSFVELHNPSNRTVSLDGHSLQVSPNGMVWTKALDLPVMTLLPPGSYYLVSFGMPAGNGAGLPMANAGSGATLPPTSGLVVLSSSTATYGCGAAKVDLVGYGGVGCAESSPAPQLSLTTAALRGNDGCLDTNSNAADFTTTTPVPRTLASMTHVCSCVANESDTNAEINYCVLQSPPTMTVDAGAMTPSVYAQVYQAMMTEAMGANPAISMQIGYGPAGTNPQNQPGWTWFPTAYNLQSGSNDEYAVSFAAPAASGSYRYTGRVSKDGINWTYCDLDGAGGLPMISFQPWNLGVMNANAVPVAPQITSPNNATFIQGAEGSFHVTASGVPPPSFFLTGQLPMGLQFNGMSGEIYGMPLTGSVGGWPLTFTAVNGVMPDATQNFALVVAAPPCTLDVDGDGSVGALTDGVLLLRAMLGMTGTAVWTNALGQDAPRNSWPLLREYLNGRCGANFAP